MIRKCLNGEIDMILTKSISRFSRNTPDTIKYVRMLRDKNIAIMFEKENINTLDMNGEMLLTILSSLAQEEVESLSSNVKMGLQMKMKRGELVGFNGCFGYDYHQDTKTITVNETEAETVRLIYDMYLQGNGCGTIAKRLVELGIKNKCGTVEWHDHGVMGMIKNEKYKGDVLLGKTFTVDPISKGRLANMGEEKTKKIIATIPLGRGAQPREIANMVLFYASDLASFATGEISDVDGGVTMDG